MLSQLNKGVKRCLRNDNQVLCFSIVVVLTVLISMHLSSPVVIKNINNSCTKCLFIILLGVSLYYRSFMLTLAVLLSMFFISSYVNAYHPVQGYSDDSIFTQVGHIIENLENTEENTGKNTVQEMSAENTEENTDENTHTHTFPTHTHTDEEKEETIEEMTVEKDEKKSTSKLENTFVSLKDKIFKSLKEVQDNVVPEDTKKNNKHSPDIGIGEYCAQGDLPDSPSGFDPNCMLTCETL